MPATRTAQAKLKYVASEQVSLRSHGTEAWLEQELRAKPGMLGFGPVKVMSFQRSHKNAGRLDLVLEDAENRIVYVGEIMLGTLDASHIVRSLDYWLREKTRQDRQDWEFVAFLVAEDVHGSRYAALARLLSGLLPLVVMEMTALRVRDLLTLEFTRIFDGTQGFEAEPITEEKGDYTKEDWIGKASPETVAITEAFHGFVRKADRDARLTYRKHFIGFAVGNRPANFISFHPKREFTRVHVAVEDAHGWAKKLKRAGIELVNDPPKGATRIRLRLTPKQAKRSAPVLEKLCMASHQYWFS